MKTRTGVSRALVEMVTISTEALTAPIRTNAQLTAADVNTAVRTLKVVFDAAVIRAIVFIRISETA